MRRAASHGPARSVRNRARRRAGGASRRARSRPGGRTGPPSRPGCSRSPRRATPNDRSRSATIVPSETWPRIGAPVVVEFGGRVVVPVRPAAIWLRSRSFSASWARRISGQRAERSRPIPAKWFPSRGRRTPGRARADRPGEGDPSPGRPPPGVAASTRRRAVVDPFAQVGRAVGDDRQPPAAARGRSDARHQRRARASIVPVARAASPPVRRGRGAARRVVGLDREQGRGGGRAAGAVGRVVGGRRLLPFEDDPGDVPIDPDAADPARRGPSVRSRSQYCGPRGEGRAGSGGLAASGG